MRAISRYRYVYYWERHRHSRSLSLAMTYRTRLVARTRSTAKQLFPVFPRLRRYVVAINNAIDDKLPLRTRVTKSQLRDRKSPITNDQFLFFFSLRKASSVAEMHPRNTTTARLIKLTKDARSNNEKRFFQVLKKKRARYPLSHSQQLKFTRLFFGGKLSELHSTFLIITERS